MKEDTCLAVNSSVGVTPTTSTRGRGKGKAALAKARQDAAAKDGFNAKVDEVRQTVAATESFAAEVEEMAVAYQLDVMDSIVPNVRARVMEGVQASDPATFLESNAAWVKSLRATSGASALFAALRPIEDSEG